MCLVVCVANLITKEATFCIFNLIGAHHDLLKMLVPLSDQINAAHTSHFLCNYFCFQFERVQVVQHVKRYRHAARMHTAAE